MIILLGLLARQHNMSPVNKFGRLDHLCLWVIKIALGILLVTLPNVVSAAEEATDKNFFVHCMNGELEKVAESLDKHQDWAAARTKNGETCLHLIGRHGPGEGTKLLLDRGADPNVRSTFKQGLRMHPLSWNVYASHVDNVQVLLENGASVNLDFDSIDKQGPVTSLDLVVQLRYITTFQLVENAGGDERFEKIESLLRQHGGKTMKELNEAEL